MLGPQLGKDITDGSGAPGLHVLLVTEIIQGNWIFSFISLVTELHAIVQREANL